MPEARPWMTTLEMQFAALNAVLANPTMDSGSRDGGESRRALLLSAMKRAEAFSWEAQSTAAVVMASRTVPVQSKFDLHNLPSHTAWWYFGVNEHLPFEALMFTTLPQPGSRSWLGGDRNFMISVTIFKSDPELRAPYPYASFLWGRDESIEDLCSASERHGKFDSERLRDITTISRFLLAAFVWLEQKVFVYASGHVERHRRKQLAREHNSPLPSDVKVIQLRRRESESRPHDANAEPVDWSCQWIVNGHWRNQPYKDEHKLIYIMPFVKGPSDKPLKIPSHTVYAVNR